MFTVAVNAEAVRAEKHPNAPTMARWARESQLNYSLILFLSTTLLFNPTENRHSTWFGFTLFSYIHKWWEFLIYENLQINFSVYYHHKIIHFFRNLNIHVKVSKCIRAFFILNNGTKWKIWNNII